MVKWVTGSILIVEQKQRRDYLLIYHQIHSRLHYQKGSSSTSSTNSSNTHGTVASAPEMTFAIEELRVGDEGEGEDEEKDGRAMEGVGEGGEEGSEEGDEDGDEEEGDEYTIRLRNLIIATPPISTFQSPMGHHHHHHHHQEQQEQSKYPLSPKSLAYRSYIHKWPHKYFAPQETTVECMACDKEGAYLKCTNCTLILCGPCKEVIVNQECGKVVGLIGTVARWKLGYKRCDQGFADIKAGGPEGVGQEGEVDRTGLVGVGGGHQVWYTPLYLKTIVPHAAKESSCLQWELHYGDAEDDPSDLLAATLTVATPPDGTEVLVGR